MMGPIRIDGNLFALTLSVVSLCVAQAYNTVHIAVAQIMSLLCEAAAKRARVHNEFRSLASDLGG